MYAIVPVLEDAHPVELVFVDEQNAKNFIDFVKTYISESGAGNGYGAYWYCKNNEIRFCRKPVGKGELHAGIIRAMAWEIDRARKALSNTHASELEWYPMIGRKGGAITFQLDKRMMPRRIRPTAGDLVRIHLGNHARNIAYVTGFEQEGKKVILRHCSYGNIVTGTIVPTRNVMKIHDFFEDGVVKT